MGDNSDCSSRFLELPSPRMNAPNTPSLRGFRLSNATLDPPPGFLHTHISAVISRLYKPGFFFLSHVEICLSLANALL
jgi:hypothetical protein